MTIQIRKLQRSDLEPVLALRLQWLSVDCSVSDTTIEVRAWFSRYLENLMALALVATDGDNCVGYVLCDFLAHPTLPGMSAIIEEVCVAEAYRTQGIGRRLVGELRERLLATVEELSTIRAQVDREDDRAISFWRMLGFEHHVIEFTDYLD